jgi:hypothetical protein
MAAKPVVRDGTSAVDNGEALHRAAREHIERMRVRGQAIVASGGNPGPSEARYFDPDVWVCCASAA